MRKTKQSARGVKRYGRTDQNQNLRAHTAGRHRCGETREDVEKAKKSSADYILLDHGKGGTGESFDWSLIRNMDRPYFLAGGLNAENVEQAILQTHPFAVDISSGVETDGVKDPKKITECIRRIRHV